MLPSFNWGDAFFWDTARWAEKFPIKVTRWREGDEGKVTMNQCGELQNSTFKNDLPALIPANSANEAL